MAEKYLTEAGLKKAFELLKENFDGLSSSIESTNSVVDAHTTKLATIEEGAQENVIETVQQNGTALTVTDKTVNVTVPTRVSELSDGADYSTTAAMQSYVAGQINDATTTIKDADGGSLGSFTANQKTNGSITIPIATSSQYGTVKLVLSTTDIGEGATLAEGTIYGVYTESE